MVSVVGCDSALADVVVEDLLLYCRRIIVGDLFVVVVGDFVVVVVGDVGAVVVGLDFVDMLGVVVVISNRTRRRGRRRRRPSSTM